MSSGRHAVFHFTDNYVSTKVSYSHINRIVQYFVTLHAVALFFPQITYIYCPKQNMSLTRDEENCTTRSFPKRTLHQIVQDVQIDDKLKNAYKL